MLNVNTIKSYPELQVAVFAKLSQMFSENGEEHMPKEFVAAELNKAFGFNADESWTIHWAWAERHGNVNALNYSERQELAELATEEAIADGTFFTICQSCCWPILNTQEKVWQSMAAEGHICNDCAARYNQNP